MHDDVLLDNFGGVDDQGGVVEVDFDLRQPAAMIAVTEQELANELDIDFPDMHIACVALRRWQAHANEDVTLIERLADADFVISYHAETGTSPHDRDGSISLTASMWFATIEEADAALLNLGAEARWASFTPIDSGSAEISKRFIVGLGALWSS